MAGKGGEQNNRRDGKIMLPPLPLSAWENLKPREDPHPKFFNPVPSQERGRIFLSAVREETTAQ